MTDYKSMVRPDTFVGRYMEFMESIETARVYDIWCALWLLSIAAGRECVVARPRAPVFLNLYLMMVAESGVTRKSTAIRNATKVLRGFIERVDPVLALIEGGSSASQLEIQLHDLSEQHGRACVAIAVSELVTFLGREVNRLGLPGLLTDLYDCPAVREGGGTAIAGKRTFREVYLSFITACAPSWMAGSIHRDVVEGGFTSRCFVIHDETPKRRIAWPSDHRDEASVIEGFVDELEIVRRTVNDGVTSIGINPLALRRFEEWYASRNLSDDPYLASFEGREDGHILRVAALFSINDGAWEINAHHLAHATRLIAEVKESGSKVFSEASTNSKYVLGIDKVRDVLCAAGVNGIAQSELIVKVRNYFSARTLAVTMTILHELDMVQKFEVHDTGGRKRIVWRATQNILMPGSTTLALNRLGGTDVDDR